MSRPSGVAVEPSDESSLAWTVPNRRTTTRTSRLAFLPIITSVVYESCSAAARALVSAFRSSLPGRSAIDEQSQRSTHRARSRPSERSVHHLLHHLLQHRQPRRRWLRLQREPRCRDSWVAVGGKAAAAGSPESQQSFRLQALPRSQLQRKWAMLFAVFV